MPHVIIGTAGHIDHGKTALVKALTGIDADRLKEEKERGITIDLGFANLPIDEGTTLGFVDVPGHERFIKNMLAGVGGIDIVMLVIAADESVMPQTREHLAICSLLRVRHGITVLTKIDAVDADTADVVEIEVQELLEGTFLEKAPLLRVSARTGQGIPDLVRALSHLASTIVPRDASQIFRLPVDRAFTMKGFGAVAAGTLIAGRVQRDDEVELLPSRKSARVRGIQVHGHATDSASAGQRTALNLQRVTLEDVHRGMVVTVPGVFTATTSFDVELELLPDVEPMPSRKRIRFHVGTSELIGRVVLLGQDELAPGGRSFARVRLEQPAFALPGDRFIVRQYSPMTTLGGGVVLDSHPPRLRRADKNIVQRLTVLRDGTTADRVLQLVRESGDAGLDDGSLMARTGLTPGAIAASRSELLQTGAVRTIESNPPTIAATAAFDAAAARAMQTVRAFHAAEPLVKGIGREDLKARAFKHASPAFFRAVVDALAADRQLAADQDVVHQFGRAVTFQGADEQHREVLAARFRDLGLQAPPPDEVIASAKVDRATGRKILQLLLKDQSLVKVNESLIVDRAALQKLVDDVRARKALNPKLGVGEFKELTGLSRKFAVPLLEYLDAQRITRRVGDDRIIL